MKLIGFFMPRIEYILLIAIFWGIVASGPRILNFDGDLPRHILTGSLILQTGKVSTTDIFSFRTMGRQSFPHEWLSQVLFAAAYYRLGLDGIVLLTALVIILTWGVVYRQAMRQSNSFFSALILTALGVAASQIHILPRPHVFTYLLAAIWITLLESLDEGKTRAWWALPLVMLIWVNMHGMFVLGMMILGIYLVGDFLTNPARAWFTHAKTTSLLLGGGFSLVATFLSPSGPKIWEAVASLGSNSYITSKIPEYQSPNFHLPETWPFLILLAFTLLAFARATEPIPWKYVLLIISFTILALYSSRMIPLFAVVAAPMIAKVIADWLRNEFPRGKFWALERNILTINSASNGFIWIIAVITITALILGSGGTIDPAGQGNVFDGRFFPVQAVSWIETHPRRGHMFNEFDWGGYLLLRMWPRYQIFMDGHTHIYGEALTREYEQVIRMTEGWQDVLEKYDIRWVILRNGAPLVQTLSKLDGWDVAYEDMTATILVHR